MTTPSARPLPLPDDTSAGYWAAAADHVLALARCGRCATFVHPPEIVCPQCQNPEPEYEWVPVDDSGTVRSWTVVHDSFLPGFDDLVPFVLVDVELDAQAGLRLVGRLTDGVGVPLHAGARVATVFEDLSPGVAVPAFALVDQ